MNDKWPGPITVAEAIRILSELPPDLPLWTDDRDGWSPVTRVELTGDGAPYNPSDDKPAPTFVWVTS